MDLTAIGGLEPLPPSARSITVSKVRSYYKEQHTNSKGKEKRDHLKVTVTCKRKMLRTHAHHRLNNHRKAAEERASPAVRHLKEAKTMSSSSVCLQRGQIMSSPGRSTGFGVLNDTLIRVSYVHNELFLYFWSHVAYKNRPRL
jgi:hypothetical protein